MKLITHPKKVRPTAMTLSTTPMVVFFSQTVELRIEPGDTLAAVAGQIEEQWRLSTPTARALAACWFALGERIARGRLDRPWTRAELDADPAREYLGRRRRA